MKKRILSFLFLIPAVMVLVGAFFPSQTVQLEFASLPEDLMSLADKGGVGELTDSPAEPLKGEPKYLSAPFYGVLVLGEGPGSRFIFSTDGSNLYFDSDQDRNLRNNRPLASQSGIKGLSRKTLLFFPPISVRLSYSSDEALPEYLLALTCDLEEKNFSFVNLGYRFGTIVFLSPAKNMKVAIYDSNPPNGMLNDFGKDVLLLDLNRDGKFDIGPDSPEKVLLTKTQGFEGNIYAIGVPVSGEYLDIREYISGHKPSGEVAIMYRTERNDKVKEQKGEGEVVFGRSGFQVLCSKGPAAFRRGGKSEVFIKYGELTLEDPYNRPWKAKFVGSWSMPAAELTSFPSRFDVGFPFKQSLITDKEEYHPGENVVFSMYLTGQAKETYTYFAPGEKSSKTQPPGTDPNKLFFEETRPRLVIKDSSGNVIAEGEMSPAEPQGCYQFTYRIPATILISEEGILYKAVSSWDTGAFQEVVTTETQFFVVKEKQ